MKGFRDGKKLQSVRKIIRIVKKGLQKILEAQPNLKVKLLQMSLDPPGLDNFNENDL